MANYQVVKLIEMVLEMDFLKLMIKIQVNGLKEIMRMGRNMVHGKPTMKMVNSLKGKFS